MNKSSFYFPHDGNARNDERLISVRMKYGAEGYGIYFMIVERLLESSGYTSIRDYNVIAFDLRVDASKVKSIIEDFGLFVFTEDGKYFYSESFNNRMAPLDNMRNQRRQAGIKSAEKRAKSNDRSTTVQRPLGQNPTEEKEEKEEKDNIPPISPCGGGSADEVAVDETEVEAFVEKEKKVAPKKEKPEPPAIEEFVAYGLANITGVTSYRLDLWENALRLKYKAWLEAGWKTGGKNPKDIQVWKTTLLHTIPYLERVVSMQIHSQPQTSKLEHNLSVVSRTWGIN